MLDAEGTKCWIPWDASREGYGAAPGAGGSIGSPNLNKTHLTVKSYYRSFNPSLATPDSFEQTFAEMAKFHRALPIPDFGDYCYPDPLKVQ